MKIPEWLTYARPNSALNTRDVCALLGIKVSALHSRIFVGTFPKPDFKAAGFTRCAGRSNAKNEWRVKTIIQWIKAQV